MLRTLGQSLLYGLYPPRCAACRKVGCDDWCDECSQCITYLSLPVCSRCGIPLNEGESCVTCLSRPLVPEAVRAVSDYSGAIKTAIRRFKYNKQPALAPTLAKLLVLGWQSPLTAPLRDVRIVLPMPIHPRRKRERGFDQCRLLASAFCRETNLPMLCGVLQRTVYRRPQIGLTMTQRRQNVADAFVVVNAAEVVGESVLLIDDVWTTGSTLNEASKTLLAAGAGRVFAYTVAHGM